MNRYGFIQQYLRFRSYQLTFLRLYSQNHYEILGVKKNASEKEIKLAYKNLSKKLHPDVNQSDPKTHEKFVRINQAYSVLSKASSREDYDRKLNDHYIYGEVHRTTYESPHYGSQFYRYQDSSQYHANDYRENYKHHPDPKTPESIKARKGLRFMLDNLVWIFAVILVIRFTLMIMSHRELDANSRRALMDYKRSQDNFVLGDHELLRTSQAKTREEKMQEIKEAKQKAVLERQASK